ncbi:VrtJ [Hirsutella rhossiliensis]|uniref:VrtJ n=1 Tax=Hirsutella rhossiliensis TaxID=111463 RepID=A0A9P8MU66_9HYPO|nr:VrtJ [Hirsutella rhossiliensis]KAH0961305.1 VrtJ [Hirsutella rhossiliensis]
MLPEAGQVELRRWRGRAGRGTARRRRRAVAVRAEAASRGRAGAGVRRVRAAGRARRRIGGDAPPPAARLRARLPGRAQGLTPVEEKLIALNSCYGFVTKDSIPGGKRQGVRHPRHVKGHITEFPNDVQGLATNGLPHPLLRVMDEIHVSWQGAERPGPRDLSGLLSVRRRPVERALAWLKENNPHYSEVEVDTAEMDSWGEPAHGVPAAVWERLEHNEPSARERTQTAQLVPPTERAMDDEGVVEIEEVLAMLRQGRDPAEGRPDPGPTYEGAGNGEDLEGARPEEEGDIINEVTSSGMFDGAPEVADADKIRFAREAIGTIGPRTWVNMAAGGAAGGAARSSGRGGDSEPYIQVRRGDEFADSADASFFARAFPTLLPFGLGGPRLADEAAAGEGAAAAAGRRGDDSATPVPAVFVFVPGMPVVVNQNTHQGLKVVNGAGYTAVAVIPDRAFPATGWMPAGTILLTPISVKITAQRKRPWQRNDVSRRGLPCAAAFACTDYKVQGGTIERVALELRGARTTTVEGRAVASPCDPYSLYVQLAVPDARRHHARVGGAGAGLHREPGAEGDDSGAGTAGGAKRADDARGGRPTRG